MTFNLDKPCVLLVFDKKDVKHFRFKRNLGMISLTAWMLE
ncbi:hypothetical protein HOLDEFILI_00030 [Holdemania filiformis DSM 12042]|uniref:Uncharacterized protein n=1 Tax=Holdemania filiformis DSM 12042 TaxID=545696 RepID=B9Y2K5_9FIRM|nr:hypothetical protein HOLDEFILI_00030 [Holdemania filiformis DSM 12042]